MHRAVQTLLWVIVENAMAPKEVREASGLEGTQQISTEIYRWQIQGQIGCKFKAVEISWGDRGHMYVWVILQHTTRGKE